MKAEEKPVYTYFFGDQQGRKGSKGKLTRGKSVSRPVASRPSRFDSSNHLNQTQDEYFPDSSSKPRNNLASVYSPRKVFSRKDLLIQSSGKNSADGTLNFSEKSTRLALQKQISRLTNELENKDKQLICRNGIAANKIKENEVVELYRSLNFYQGKIKKMQQQAKKYEETLSAIAKSCDEKSRHKSHVEELVRMFEEMRGDIEQISGKLQEKQYQIGRLNDKLKKKQLKKNLLDRKKTAILLRRKQNSADSAQSFRVRSKELKSASQLMMMKDIYGNLNSKINTIESNLAFLERQNERLHQQLNEKSQKILECEMEIEYLRNKLNLCTLEENAKNSRLSSSNRNQSTIKGITIKGQQQSPSSILIRKQAQSSSILNKSRGNPLNQLTILPEDFLKDEVMQGDSVPVSQKNSPADRYGEITEQIRPEIFRRLRYQLITEEISYEDLLNFLISEQNEVEVLEEYPYNLVSEEAEWLCQWLQDLKEQISIRSGEDINEELEAYLKQVIPAYECLSLRAQNNLKIQIYNAFQNRQSELAKQLEGRRFNEKKVPFEDLLDYFRSWPLTEKHLDVLGKSIYEQTDFEVAYKLLSKWG